MGDIGASPFQRTTHLRRRIAPSQIDSKKLNNAQRNACLLGEKKDTNSNDNANVDKCPNGKRSTNAGSNPIRENEEGASLSAGTSCSESIQSIDTWKNGNTSAQNSPRIAEHSKTSQELSPKPSTSKLSQHESNEMSSYLLDESSEEQPDLDKEIDNIFAGLESSDLMDVSFQFDEIYNALSPMSPTNIDTCSDALVNEISDQDDSTQIADIIVDRPVLFSDVISQPKHVEQKNRSLRIQEAIQKWTPMMNKTQCDLKRINPLCTIHKSIWKTATIDERRQQFSLSSSAKRTKPNASFLNLLSSWTKRTESVEDQPQQTVGKATIVEDAVVVGPSGISKIKEKYSNADETLKNCSHTSQVDCSTTGANKKRNALLQAEGSSVAKVNESIQISTKSSRVSFSGINLRQKKLFEKGDSRENLNDFEPNQRGKQMAQFDGQHNIFSISTKEASKVEKVAMASVEKESIIHVDHSSSSIIDTNSKTGNVCFKFTMDENNNEEIEKGETVQKSDLQNTIAKATLLGQSTMMDENVSSFTGQKTMRRKLKRKFEDIDTDTDIVQPKKPKTKVKVVRTASGYFIEEPMNVPSIFPRNKRKSCYIDEDDVRSLLPRPNWEINTQFETEKPQVKRARTMLIELDDIIFRSVKSKEARSRDRKYIHLTRSKKNQ